jgi:hypothetical protein
VIGSVTVQPRESLCWDAGECRSYEEHGERTWNNVGAEASPVTPRTMSGGSAAIKQA